LDGLLIEASEAVHITGYDLKTGIRSKIAADIRMPGAIVLNARLFGEIIRKLPEDIVSISVDDALAATISCGISVFHIMGMPAEDFPALPVLESEKSLRVPQNTLKTMISETIFSVSTDESRPIHTGSLFEVENGTLTVVSIDGFRLALRRTPLAETEADGIRFVVPGAALREVEKIALNSEELVKIDLGEKHIMFTIEDTILISRRLEGEFLNYKQVIPQNKEFSVTVDRQSLINCVERVSLIISEQLKSPVRCVFDETVLRFSVATPLGKAADACSISGDCAELEIGFNNRYLLDALKAAPADTLRLDMGSSTSPCVIRAADGTEAFLYMILPVRLRASED